MDCEYAAEKAIWLFLVEFWILLNFVRGNYILGKNFDHNIQRTAAEVGSAK